MSETGGTPLGLDAIKALLDSKPAKAAQVVSKQHPRPVHIGVLRYREEPTRCMSRGCGSPTTIWINGIAYCSSHALVILNELVMKLDGTYEKYNLDSCDCSQGHHTKNNTHSVGCPVYTSVKETNA